MDVLVPANSEGTRATVLRWCKRVGDHVTKDEPLVELETDKVTVEIPSPAEGQLVEVLKEVNSEVTPEEVLARIKVGEQAPSVSAEVVAPTPRAATADGSAAREGSSALSPSVRRLLHQNSLIAADIAGSGRNGRITAQDVLRHVTSQAQGGPRPAAVSSQAQAQATQSTKIPHTPIRRRVAEHMAHSMAEAPHVTTLFEADLTRVLAHRARHAAAYEARGARLTLTAYFLSACIRALRAHPELNATFHADAMEVHSNINIGVGTALGNKGLIVPVIHRAQGMNLFGLAQRLGQVVEAARANKLTPEEVRGGTFTISNHGVGGSLLAAPIVINQPQVAILGVGKVQRRVCVIDSDAGEAICIRSMCYLTLTIDHRALDAFQANAFLTHVTATLEHWTDES
jgi:2-oxoglutarate dehydrogenase E2 component (dihydrolipoamide succinyltransferase)